MPAKCDWHIDLTVEEEGDPFAADERGLPIEIGDEEARVSKALVKTVEKEGRLAERGVTCQIKDRPDTSCWACPVYQGNTTHALSVLCRLGREQERLVTRSAVLHIEKGQREGA